ELPDPEWDPERSPDGPDRVFRVDLTWLTSSWTCIFGRGCPGIYRDHPEDGCCTMGAHFTDADDEERVAGFVDLLGPEDWQRRPDGASVAREAWVEVDEDGDRKTRRAPGGACVLLNDPGFPGGAGCALHHLAARLGRSYVETKPDVCWQLPLRRSYRDVERPDGTSYQEVTIAECDRRGWGPGGHDLDWYCTGAPEARVGAQPMRLSARGELVELVGVPARRRRCLRRAVRWDRARRCRSRGLAFAACRAPPPRARAPAPPSRAPSAGGPPRSGSVAAGSARPGARSRRTRRRRDRARSRGRPRA